MRLPTACLASSFTAIEFWPHRYGDGAASLHLQAVHRVGLGLTWNLCIHTNRRRRSTVRDSGQDESLDRISEADQAHQTAARYCPRSRPATKHPLCLHAHFFRLPRILPLRLESRRHVDDYCRQAVARPDETGQRL